MPDQPRAQWLDAWGFAAVSVFLLLAQRASSPSSLWAVCIFLLAVLAVWAFTSRRLTLVSSGGLRPPDPLTRSLAGPRRPAPLAWLTRFRSFALFVRWFLQTPASAGPADLSDATTGIGESPEVAAEASCPVCGLTVSDSARVCKCGAPRLTDADRQRLRGPRGWLAVYRFVMLVVAPFGVARVIVASLANANDFTAGDWLRILPAILLDSVPILYGVFVVALLAHERPEGVRHARQFLILDLMCFVGLVVQVGVLSGARAAIDLMPYFLAGLLGTCLWILYFRRSRRVLVTYGPGALRSRVAVRTLARGTIAIALVVFVPIATLWAFWPSTERGWAVYAPTTGGFRVELPGTPAASEESFAEADGTVSVLSTALVETWDGIVLSVSFEDLPPDADLSDRAAIMDAMRDGAIESAVLQQTQTVVVQGVAGREFVAHYPNQEFFLAGRTSWWIARRLRSWRSPQECARQRMCSPRTGF